MQTPVLATFAETSDIKTIRIARPQGFSFEAGQFIPVRLRVDGSDHVRCYSVSSSPASAGYLEISVKRQGLVSNALHATGRPGAILSIKSPNGGFKYPSGDDRPIVLLAGGVGITPLMSMLRHAIHAEPSRPVTLVYAAQTVEGFAFRDELTSISSRHPQVRVVFAVTQGPPPQSAFYPGRIDEGLLRATVPDLAHSISFICGPPSMIDGTRALLERLGVPAAQIRYEVFQAAVAASVGARGPDDRPEPTTTEWSGAAAGPATPSPCRTATRSTMRCLIARRHVPIEHGQSLLEAAEGGGIEVPSLCRAGVCGTCRVRVAEGSVEFVSTTLDEADQSQGFVLACVATGNGDCAVEI